MDKTSNWATKTTHCALNIESGKRIIELGKVERQFESKQKY